MAEEQEVSSSAARMCANGCGFFGSAATKNFCSKCYRDMIRTAAPVHASTEEKTTTVKPNKKTAVVPPAATSASGSTAAATEAAPPVTAADESTTVVTKEKQEEKAPAAILCVRGCGFFGSAATKNMCSKCHIDHIMTVDATPDLLEKIEADKAAVAKVATVEKPAAPAAEEEAAAAPAVEPPKAASNRCMACRKKVGLLGFACRCGGTFCSLHRYAEKHACDFDYKALDREQIAKNNPLVVASKLDKI